LRRHGAGRGSKVWYTVAGGVLSDVYEPTIDNTDVSTLQYVVTDGSTFTDLQTRDMTYTVAADRSGMACTVTSTDAKHGFRLVTTYITDPARDTVLMRTRLEGNTKNLHLYARLDAHVNGNGGGGTQNAGANSGVVDTNTVTKPAGPPTTRACDPRPRTCQACATAKTASRAATTCPPTS
jgi:glucoamylase